MKSPLFLLDYVKLFRLPCCEQLMCLCILSLSNICSMEVCGLSMFQGGGCLDWICILEVVRREQLTHASEIHVIMNHVVASMLATSPRVKMIICERTP